VAPRRKRIAKTRVLDRAAVVVALVPGAVGLPGGEEEVDAVLETVMGAVPLQARENPGPLDGVFS
jgi:hypothetical protein